MAASYAVAALTTESLQYMLASKRSNTSRLALARAYFEQGRQTKSKIRSAAHLSKQMHPCLVRRPHPSKDVIFARCRFQNFAKPVLDSKTSTARLGTRPLRVY